MAGNLLLLVFLLLNLKHLQLLLSFDNEISIGVRPKRVILLRWIVLLGLVIVEHKSIAKASQTLWITLGEHTPLALGQVADFPERI